jgi:catechol 2,3-dioxygenase-like lactoylglutathione lyase family enzyme
MITVKRIVSNIHASDLSAAKAFYQDILGMEVLMDLGWIQTLGSGETMKVQLSVETQGGSGTVTPDLSIEVNDVDEAYLLFLSSEFKIEYGIVDEPWGVRRFYVRDPFGKLVNILSHVDSIR